MSVLPPIEQKASYVEHMFSRIAARYDMMNALMTFGMDRGWRRRAIGLVDVPRAGYALDIGTGTGDFLPLLAERGAFAVGADFTLAMMQAGLPKVAAHSTKAAFVNGDALCLPFPDACFDVITTGFMMRNVVDISQAFAEMYRVARPGGRMVCLEVARPQHGILRLGHMLYFERVVPLLAQSFGGDKQAYTYLPQSARLFPAPERLAVLMRDAGWQQVEFRLLSLGAVALHVGTKG